MEDWIPRDEEVGDTSRRQSGLELKKRVLPTTRLAAWATKEGLLALLTCNQIKVYVAICFTSNNTTKTSWAKQETLSKYSGVSRSSIPAATRFLRDVGLVLMKRRGNRMTYQVLLSPPRESEIGRVREARSGRRMHVNSKSNLLKGRGNSSSLPNQPNSCFRKTQLTAPIDSEDDDCFERSPYAAG